MQTNRTLFSPFARFATCMYFALKCNNPCSSHQSTRHRVEYGIFRIRFCIRKQRKKNHWTKNRNNSKLFSSPLFLSNCSATLCSKSEKKKIGDQEGKRWPLKQRKLFFETCHTSSSFGACCFERAHPDEFCYKTFICYKFKHRHTHTLRRVSTVIKKGYLQINFENKTKNFLIVFCGIEWKRTVFFQYDTLLSLLCVYLCGSWMNDEIKTNYPFHNAHCMRYDDIFPLNHIFFPLEK